MPHVRNQNLFSNQTFELPQHWFTSQSSKPIFIEDAKIEELSPLLRSLCVSDGTVTRLLSVYHLELIHVLITQQSVKVALPYPDTQRIFHCSPQAAILHRNVDIIGSSGTLYAHAFSQCHMSALPQNILSSLQEDIQNIGQALLTHLPDNNRQLLWFGWATTHDLIQHIPDFDPDHDVKRFLCRCYLVRSGQTPLMQIMECFPDTL